MEQVRIEQEAKRFNELRSTKTSCIYHIDHPL